MAGHRRRHPLLFVTFATLLAAMPRAQEGQGDDWATAIAGARRKLAKGDWSGAEAALQEVLDAAQEEPEGSRPAPKFVAEARLLLADLSDRGGKYEEALTALGELPPEFRGGREVLLLKAHVLARRGGYADAIALLQPLVGDADPEARHEVGELHWRAGRVAEAKKLWQQNAALGGSPANRTPDQLAAIGRSLVRLGGRVNLEAASRVLVEALRQAPEHTAARIALGIAKFDAYGEAGGFPSGEKDLAKVLETCGDDETALLAMYRIRSRNQALDGGKTERVLDRVLARNPRCVEALVERAGNVLDDRRYRDAAQRLDEALAIDPNDRNALCHRAAASWLLHDEKGHAAFRGRALAGDPGLPDVDRCLGDHLVALYRFADAVPFYEAALAVAPEDVASLQGLARALVYTGQGKRAKEVLTKAKALAAGLVDPWRNNALAVQDLLDEQYVRIETNRFAVSMHRADAEVLQAYLVPVLLQAYEELGAKYSFRPTERVEVEAFHTWDDFSVRTIGFRGFTALGACFGPFLTLVSPSDGDLRRQDFMWEATVWHEYTHVLTLGLSKHRVPRWLTEGFSVYEEKERDRTWERGMDRELFDAYHNHDIPPVHLLNRLFRGPRILFGYYQGGLIVEWIARQYGFQKAIALLQCFGEDMDTEKAFQTALGVSSAAFDVELLRYVADTKLAGMRLVPRYDDAAVQRMVVQAGRDRSDLGVRVQLAWAFVQRDNPVDAGRWLAEVSRADPDHAGASLVRAELLYRRKERDAAIEAWRRGFAGGADDFDSRLHCGDALLAAGDAAGAEDMYQRAKACWPNCTEQDTAPELKLARLYRDQGDRARAQAEMKTFCGRTARAFTPRYTLATFEKEAGNRAEELRYLVECNRIDPFHRELHVRLGEAYEALGKPIDAAREYEVGAAVPPDLDRRAMQKDWEQRAPDAPEELGERGALWVRAAKLRHAAGDAPKVAELLNRTERDAPGSPAATEAKRLRQDWQVH